MPHRRSRNSRIALVVSVVVVLILGALGAFVAVRGSRTLEDANDAETRDVAGPWLRPSCRLPVEYLERTQRGYFDGRSPDVTVVPKAPNFTGSFGFTTHAGPWAYVQRVPLVLYGPGFIESRGEIRLDRDVDLADLPSTLAELLDTPLPQGAGSPIEEALVPPDQRSEDLKLIVTVVWDGGGWNVLNRYPNAWPNLKRLMQRGTSLRNVMVGSSPSTTPAVHSTIGTGAWPSKHGAVDIPMRKDGEMVASFEGLSADDVLLPTLADLYDQATGNEAKVGMVAERPWHLGMLGHGASLVGGDKDIAVLWNLEHELVTNPDFYRIPSYLDARPTLDEELRILDAEDGRIDSAWLGNEVLNDRSEWRNSPLWTMYQPELLRSIVTNEGFGQDDVTDLLFTNFKHIDVVGHYPKLAMELRSTIRYTDGALAELMRNLDQDVGKGQWVLAFTADHGQTPDPAVTGAWPIDLSALTDDVEAHFGVDSDRLIEEERPNGLWLDQVTMRAHDITADAISSFLLDYRIRDNYEPDRRPAPEVYSARLNERLFSAAFPAGRVDGVLRCAERRSGD